MLLVSNKAAFFKIVIAAGAPPPVRYAAEELQKYIERITLARSTIGSDEGEPSAPEILVGDSKHRGDLFPDAQASSLPREGYVLQSHHSSLLLLGGSPRATLYAVYDLLERLGVRWWTPWDENVPRRMILEIEPLNIEVRPPLLYRALWYRNAMDPDWQARMRLNAGCMSPIHLQERHGGGERFAADASAHTYEGLLPTDRYFDAHPEYFSEVNGVRLRHMNQLCPTHPEVARIAAETARRWLESTPGARLISVTQNDWGNWCTCPACALMIEREGSPSGPMLHLANEVARLLEKEYPDVFVDTFGYSWSEKPPRHMKAHPNVLVRLAPIGNCFGHTIRACPANERCRAALAGWSRAAQHLFVWHYVTDFFHYLTPFPNLPPLGEDLDYYLEHGVKGIFLQGDGTSLGGDLCELKAYLMARLLWNPSLNPETVRAEFLSGYYREASSAVEDYIRTFEKAFARAGSKAHLFLYRSLWENDAAYLARPVLAKACKALDRGFKAAKDDPQALERLERIRAALDYTELFYYCRPDRRVLRGRWMECRASAPRRKLLDRFFRAADRSRVTHYAEDLGRYTTIDSLRRAWLESIGPHDTARLAAGGAYAVLVPALGGRIVEYGPQGRKINLLGQGSPITFGYPCTGGYEEYTLRPHQSPGFSEHFRVVRKTTSMVVLKGEVETGLELERRIRLDGRSGALLIQTRLRNPQDVELPGCLRAHLEIDLRTRVSEIEFWVLRDGAWERRQGPLSLAWYEGEVPDGWAFWSPRSTLGIWQKWERGQVGAIFLGGIPSEPTVLALDLACSRGNRPIAPGGHQKLWHRMGWLDKPM